MVLGCTDDTDYVSILYKFSYSNHELFPPLNDNSETEGTFQWTCRKHLHVANHLHV